MIVSDLAVKKRTSVMVLALMILVFGPLSYFSLPRESAPDITIPFVFIMTNYAGVAPEDIESQSLVIVVTEELRTEVEVPSHHDLATGDDSDHTLLQVHPHQPSISLAHPK